MNRRDQTSIAVLIALAGLLSSCAQLRGGLPGERTTSGIERSDSLPVDSTDDFFGDDSLSDFEFPEAPERDPMANFPDDRPLPVLVEGPLEQIDCMTGERELHARMAVEARGGQVTSFAYYSRWNFYTCSLDLHRVDPTIKWRKTAAGATRVQTPNGSFIIHAHADRYVFEFHDVERMRFCGMYGRTNGTMTIKRGLAEPKCSAQGIMDRD
jgi:hypothetical protein